MRLHVLIECVGGGLGGTRRGAPNECIKYSGRVDERLVLCDIIQR